MSNHAQPPRPADRPDTRPDHRPRVHPPAQPRRGLLDALDTLDLTPPDQRIDWLAGWDDPTVDAIASLITRARAAASTGSRP